MQETLALTTDTDQQIVNLVNDIRGIAMTLSMHLRSIRRDPYQLVEHPEEMEFLLTLVESTDFGHEASGLWDYLDHLKFHLASDYGMDFEPEEDDEFDDEDEAPEDESSDE